MQYGSSILRTPLADMAAANGQVHSRQASVGSKDLSHMLDASPNAAATCKPDADAARTFSRQKRQHSHAGKRKADLSWLLGDDDTPASSSKHQQISYPADAWGTFDSLDWAPKAAEPQLNSSGSTAGELKLDNGVVTR